MRRLKLGLILSAILFAGWMGYLAYLAFSVRQEASASGGQPIVLSRPQFLVADLVVTAQIADQETRPSEAHVKEVHWSRAGTAEQWLGQRRVGGLSESRGLADAGEYVLPLLVVEAGALRVAPTPPSPGYSEANPPRVYPNTPFTREQLRQIIQDQMKDR